MHKYTIVQAAEFAIDFRCSYTGSVMSLGGNIGYLCCK